MARVKLSEYKAKQLLYERLNLQGKIFSYKKDEDLSFKFLDFSSEKRYTVKVDQGIKGRFKKGLVELDKTQKEVLEAIKRYEKNGYSSFFIEEFISHTKLQEYYLSFERIRSGIRIYYSKHGGVDIEKNKESINELIIRDKKDLKKVSQYLNLEHGFLEIILDIFDGLYLAFLEINPLVVNANKVHILDLAVEVDSTAEFFVNGKWSQSDFISDIRLKTKEEEEILNLSQKSQAAFKLDVLNPNGSIFMLLSGGGASIVLADEVYNQGFDKELANYGEYSGNPSEEETYIYTKNLLSLLLSSNAQKKVLIIGGGVANFTDIRITFKGIIRALFEKKSELKKQNLKVFVRRGGPHQKQGLELMENFLQTESILGKVSGPEMILTDIVILALNFLKND